MNASNAESQLPRIEEFRSDLTPAQIAAAEAGNTRAIAMQAYLYAFPAFLHMRQLTEFIQGRSYMAPDECPLGGWVLIREFSTPQTATVSPNVDTLYGASYVLLDQQGPVVLHVPPIPGRYYSVALLDAYFIDFDVISPRTFGNDGGDFLIAPPGWAGATPAGIRAVLHATTPSICLLQRIYTRDAGEFAMLHEVQNAIRLTPLDRWLRGAQGFPPLDLAAYNIPAMRMVRDPLAILCAHQLLHRRQPAAAGRCRAGRTVPQRGRRAWLDAAGGRKRAPGHRPGRRRCPGRHECAHLRRAVPQRLARA
jgi:hypothetical protein